LTEYRIAPETIRRYRRRVLQRDIAIMVLLYLSITAVALAQGSSLLILLFIVVMIALVTASRVARTARSIDENLGGYLVVLDGDRLTRPPALTIARDEVTAIEERRGGGLAVWGPDRQTMIPVPEMVEGYVDLRRILSSWKAIEKRN
jgi:hypothetical protein